MIRAARDAGAKQRNALRACLFLVLALPLLTLPVRAAEVRLLQTQTVTAHTTALAASPAGDTLRLQLTAGPRTHDLRLRPNTHLGIIAGRTADRATAFEGRLADQPGSWAAVTRIGSRWSGIWFDGAEYFGIDEAAALADSSAAAAAAAPRQLLVYRLRDAVWDNIDFHGDTVRPPASAVEYLERIGAEIAAPASQLALLPTRRLTVALLADADLVRQDGALTEANMLAQMNVVDGIFANQVGVRVQSGSVTLFDFRTDPFSGTTNADTLLTELRDYRASSPTQRSAGLSQLMTARNLDGRTVGIAYLGGLCSPLYSASLSQATMSVSFTALITAHEIGHVFGAPHDTESGSACESTPASYLMAPQLNGSQTFSSCSLERITPVVTAASCLAPADAADSGVEAPSEVRLALNRATDVTISIRALGNVPSLNNRLRVTLPLWLELIDATSPVGSCSRSSNVVDCTFGTLEPGATANLTLRLSSGVSGTGSAALRVTATDDRLPGNDTASIRFSAEPGADLVASADASPITLLTGETTTATVVVLNRGPAGVDDARLDITLPPSVTLVRHTGTDITCAPATGGNLTCGPVALALDGTARVELVLTPTVAGSALIEATVRSSRAEADPFNDRAQLTLTVRSPAPVGTTNGSGGGGGALTPAALALLTLMMAARTRRRMLQTRANQASR